MRRPLGPQSAGQASRRSVVGLPCCWSDGGASCRGMKISKVGLRKGWLDRNDSGDAVEGLAVQFALIGPPSLPILRHLRDPIRVFSRKIVELRWVFCEMVQFPIGLAMFD